MRNDQLKRLLNSDVVGQLNNGLFFEGHVVDTSGTPSVVDFDGPGNRPISADVVKWVAKAVRYC